ncbi:MAG TPA: ABC transporter permease subunit [Thermomicrobiales bacterium]|nr:ABC transporter permease subunit [Thermomicrobiales bacterium]
MPLLAITRLTLRQFLRSKSLLVVVAIGFFPVIFAILPHFAGQELTLRDLRRVLGNVIYLGLFAGTLLPLATLVLSTSALGDEIEDKTLQYLTLKPIARLQIVFAKFLAILIVTIPIILAGLVVTWAVASWGRLDDMRDMLPPMLAGAVVGVLGFGAIFMLVSLFIQRALLVGIFYVFIWETALSRYLPGIRSFSIRHYTQSTFVRLLDDRAIRLDGVAALPTIWITIAVIVVVCLALATWRLRSMNLE